MSLSNHEVIARILRSHHERRFEDDKPSREYLDIFNSRDEVLARFQPLLAEPTEIHEGTFRDFLDFKLNRHWTGLQRPASHVTDDLPKLRTAISHLFNEEIPIAQRLDGLTNRGERAVRGLSFGILTALLLVRYPAKYGVWNSKSEAALKALKLWPKLPRGTTDGERYAALNQLFVEFAGRVELDLWSLDGLWHVVNERSKQKADDFFVDLEQTEKEYFEGGQHLTIGYRTERNAAARNSCVESQGFDCTVCGFNFFQFYGELGLHFIHVHHCEDLALAEGRRQVDPEKDLVPVCPNCHAMLHKGTKIARSIKDLKKRIAEAGGVQC